MDKKLASLVNKNKCLEVAKTIGLDKFILVGNKNKKTKVENKIIADSIEALIAAIYYDKGFEASEKFMITWSSYNDFILKEATDDLSESQPTAGNISGGLTTIEEKAFGNFQ